MPSQLLLKLLARLFPGVTPDGDPPAGDPPPGDDDGDDGGAVDGDPDGIDDDGDDGAGDDEPPPRQESRAQRRIRELNERAQRAERERDALIARGPAAPPQAPPQSREFEDEEAILRNPQSTDLQRWQVNSNRLLRSTVQSAQGALARAADSQDAAAYDRKALRDPVYDKYRDKVEKIVESERMKGNLISREVVLKHVIGEEFLAGNFKSKPKSGAAGKPAVPRGQPNTNARSDVPRRGDMSEREKRRARLENQII